MRWILGLGLSSVCGFAAAQTDRLNVTFSLEQFFLAGGYFGTYLTDDRMTRPSIAVESGPWRFEGSYWFYPMLDFNELDETNVSYTSGNATLKYGRMRAIVGQSGWYDQWYSGMNYVGLVEIQKYGDHRFLFHTSVGAELTVQDGPNTYQLAAVSTQPDVDRLAPTNLDRGMARWQFNHDGLTVGASAAFDTKGLGREERMLSADVRWTAPQWIARGVVAGHSDDLLNKSGFFIDVYHRPKGWSDLTFVGRYEQFDTSATERLETTTLGAKVRAPFETSLYVNYRFGPSINTNPYSGPWSIGLIKTLRF